MRLLILSDKIYAAKLNHLVALRIRRAQVNFRSSVVGFGVLKLDIIKNMCSCSRFFAQTCFDYLID